MQLMSRLHKHGDKMRAYIAIDRGTTGNSKVFSVPLWFAQESLQLHSEEAKDNDLEGGLVCTNCEQVFMMSAYKTKRST